MRHCLRKKSSIAFRTIGRQGEKAGPREFPQPGLAPKERTLTCGAGQVKVLENNLIRGDLSRRYLASSKTKFMGVASEYPELLSKRNVFPWLANGTY